MKKKHLNHWKGEWSHPIWQIVSLIWQYISPNWQHLSLCTMENWNRFRFTLINFFGPICHFLTGVGPTYEKQYLKLPA